MTEKSQTLQIVKKDDLLILRSDFERQYINPTNKDFEIKVIFEREISFALQQIDKNPYLNQCEKKSILRAVLNISQTGLTLNPVEKKAYLVPRRNSNTGIIECCLDPSYIGLKAIAVESGCIKSSVEQVIYQGDEIDFDLASEVPVKKHIPYFLKGNPKGEIIGVYSVATLPDGETHTEIIGRDDLNKIRERSEGWKASQKPDAKFKSPWEDFESEMCRKTVIKRHLKYLPHAKFIDYAIEASNQVQAMRFPCSFQSQSYAEQLLQYSILSQEKKERCQMEIESFEYQDQADKMIEYLKENQPETDKKRLKRNLK